MYPQLLGEVGDLKTRLLTVTDELFSERRRSSQELWVATKKQQEELEKKEIEIIRLQVLLCVAMCSSVILSPA